MTRFFAVLLFGLGLAGGVGPAWTQDASKSTELVPGVSASVVSLKRVPGQKMLQLDYEVKNTGTDAVAVDALGIGSSAYGLRDIALMDFKAEKAFTVGIANECLCSALPEEALGPGASMRFWAWFAPPATSPGPFAVRFGKSLPVLDVPVE